MNVPMKKIAEIDTILALSSWRVTAPFDDPPVTRCIGLIQRTGNPRAVMIEKLLTDLRQVSGEPAAS